MNKVEKQILKNQVAIMNGLQALNKENSPGTYDTFCNRIVETYNILEEDIKIGK